MTTTLTRKVVSGWAACLLTAMLVGCGGGGGDGESGNLPLSPSVAASAAIGVAGGSLEATLAGGTTVRLTVPPGALKTTTAFRIDPVPAGTGTLGTFELAPVGLEFKIPARLEITARAATAIDAETTLVFSMRGVQVPVAARVDTAARTVTVMLRRLGTGSAATSAAASRVNALGAGNATVHEARRLDAAADAVEAALAQRNFLERASLLNQLLDRLTAQGTIDNAVDAQLGIESVLGLPQTSEIDLFARRSLAVYRTVVCGQREFSVSSLNTFQDGTDHAGFLRRASDVLQWGLLAEELATIAAGFAPAETGCANLPPDRTRPVRDRFPGYLERVQSALALLDPKLDFTQILTVRMTALLAFAAGLQGSEVDDLASQVQSIAAAQTVRLRFGAYVSCVAEGSQVFQQTLLAREISDAAFLALSTFSESDLHSDIQYCGTTLTWEVQTASGAVVRNGTAGGLGVGLVRASMNVALDGGDKLVLRGPLNALRCPTGSQNNEQLAIGAGQAAGALASLGLLTPSNANTYLQASPLEIPVTQLRALTDTPGGSATPGRLVLQRTGGVCNGEFPLLQNTPALVTLVFAAAQVEVSIEPRGVNVPPGRTQQFVAMSGGQPVVGAVWSLRRTGGGAGTIDANGLYTAPLDPPSPPETSITIRVESLSGSGSIEITADVAEGGAYLGTLVTDCPVGESPPPVTARLDLRFSGLRFATHALIRRTSGSGLDIPDFAALATTTRVPSDLTLTGQFLTTTEFSSARTPVIARGGSDGVTATFRWQEPVPVYGGCARTFTGTKQ